MEPLFARPSGRVAYCNAALTWRTHFCVPGCPRGQAILPSPFRGRRTAVSSHPQRSSPASPLRSEEHTSELQSLRHLVCRLLLEKKKQTTDCYTETTRMASDASKEVEAVST